MDDVIRRDERTSTASSPGVDVAFPQHLEPVVMAGGLVVTRQVDVGGSRLCVRVAGEVDLVTAPMLAEACELARDQARRVAAVTEIVVDLRRVSFLGAAGLTELVRAYRDCFHDAVLLRVVADRPAVIRPLRLTGLDETLTLRVDPNSPVVDRVSAVSPGPGTVPVGVEPPRAGPTPIRDSPA